MKALRFTFITLLLMHFGLLLLHYHYGYSCFAGCESNRIKTSTGTVITLFIKDN